MPRSESAEKRKGRSKLSRFCVFLFFRVPELTKFGTGSIIKAVIKEKNRKRRPFHR